MPLFSKHFFNALKPGYFRIQTTTNFKYAVMITSHITKFLLKMLCVLFIFFLQGHIMNDTYSNESVKILNIKTMEMYGIITICY